MDLKKQYGRGYKLSISPRLDCSERAKAYVLSLFPTATVDTISVGTINFYIPTNDVDVSSLFSEMMRNKDENGIIEWGVSQASLEEVTMQEETRSDEKRFSSKWWRRTKLTSRSPRHEVFGRFMQFFSDKGEKPADVLWLTDDMYLLSTGREVTKEDDLCGHMTCSSLCMNAVY